MWRSASFHRPNKKELFRLIHIVLLTQSNPTLSQGKLKMYAKLDFKLTFFKAKSIWVNFRNAPFLFLVLQGTIVVGDSGERTISQDVTFYYPHILPRGTSYCSSYTLYHLLSLIQKCLSQNISFSSWNFADHQDEIANTQAKTQGLIQRQNDMNQINNDKYGTKDQC